MTDRLASQGARIGPVSLPRLGLFVVAAAALAFFCARPATRPLRTGPMLASLLVLCVAGGLLLEWRRALFVERMPLLVEETRAGLPLVLEDRRQLDRLFGRPRRDPFHRGGRPLCPHDRRLSFRALCDDRCLLGLDERGLETITGNGLVLADLARAFTSCASPTSRAEARRASPSGGTGRGRSS